MLPEDLIPFPRRVVCHLAQLLEAREMTLVELAERTGITVANLSVLKNDRARAIRFSTMTVICDALSCQPGDLFHISTEDVASPQIRRDKESS